MSTLGSYGNFFEADGKISRHVIEMRTVNSEAWTKPLFVNGREWGAKHKPNGIRAYLCEDKPNQACVWLQ